MKGPYSDLELELSWDWEGLKLKELWDAIDLGTPPAVRPWGYLKPSYTKLWDVLELSWSRDPFSRPSIDVFESTFQSLDAM